jgi:hypothetical protein
MAAANIGMRRALGVCYIRDQIIAGECGMNKSKKVLLGCGAALLTAGAAHADVTVSQTTSLDVASMVHAHGANTEYYSGDKKRHDSETHCEGLMSMFCGNLQTGEIVRLDRGVTWNLEPKKKMYREEPFATPAQIADMKAQINARLEKMKSCPAQKHETVDESKCKMSPAKFDVRKTGEHATIAGFATERTIGTMTQSCTNPDTGEVCDTVVAIDSWLTADTVPGVNDRRAFTLAYAKKLGMDDAMQNMFSGQMATYMARYQVQFSELADKAKQFKGQPLKSTFRVLSGGPSCKSVKADSPQSAGNEPASSNPLGEMSGAGKAVGQLVGGLFKKKKQPDDSAAPASAASTAPAATTTPAGNDPAFPQLVQMVAFGTETTAIKTDAVPAQTFEVPADWTKEAPRQTKTSKDDFECPRT